VRRMPLRICCCAFSVVLPMRRMSLRVCGCPVSMLQLYAVDEIDQHRLRVSCLDPAGPHVRGFKGLYHILLRVPRGRCSTPHCEKGDNVLLKITLTRSRRPRTASTREHRVCSLAIKVIDISLPAIAKYRVGLRHLFEFQHKNKCVNYTGGC